MFTRQERRGLRRRTGRERHFLLFFFPLFFFFFFFLATRTAFQILVPHLEIEPVPPAVEAQSPNHWTTREFLGEAFSD